MTQLKLRKQPRRRTGRLVWVNNDVNLIPTVSGVNLTAILTNAPDFMLFNTTIVTVIIQSLVFTYDSIAPAGTRRFFIGLRTAPELIDAVDFPNPLTDGVGPPWMAVLHNAHNVSGVAPQTLNLTPNGPVVVKAKRRFKQNNETLFLHTQSVSPAVDTNPLLSGFIRTLLYIP